MLIYCPQKVSVETTANAFLKAKKAGYFNTALPRASEPHLETALRVGREWLGDSHVAVQCLRIGVAVHHGSLPRAFLGEVENLLKRRLLTVCVCSPTLAQGVDLCFSVLLFQSLYRAGTLIPPKEFANVVGRVGRAYVDLDGIYALPIFESTATKALKKKNNFNQLILQAKSRQLESGVKLLVGVIIRILSERLNVSSEQLIEYVANMQSPWAVPSINDEDKAPGVLQACLNELDTAILGIVDTLEMPTNDLAAYLDACFQSSYWQRRLQHDDETHKQLQVAVLKGRATWIWSHTDEARRKGYFAAGVGYAAGKAFDDQLEQLGALLQAAEDALEKGSIEEAIPATIALAEIVFEIHPFIPEDIEPGWGNVLADWMRGRPLSEFADNNHVSFIQGDVVFRLVWGVEAARLHINQVIPPVPDIEEHPILALCLTYGVPNKRAAMFMQAGMNSRTLACKAAELIPSHQFCKC